MSWPMESPVATSPQADSHHTLIGITWKGVILSIFLWVMWAGAVFGLMAQWGRSVHPWIQVQSKFWMEAFFDFPAQHPPPGGWEGLLQGVGFLVSGLGLVLWVWRPRKAAGAAWGLTGALGLACLGNLSEMPESWWAAACLLGALVVLISRKEHREIFPARKRSYFLPFLFLALLILPLTQLNLAWSPLGFPPYNTENAAALLARAENPDSLDTPLVWNQGKLSDTWLSWIHIRSMGLWTDHVGLTVGGMRSWPVALFLVSLPLLFWGVESFVGAWAALGFLLFYSLGFWQVFTVREITFLPLTLIQISLFMVTAIWCLRGRAWYRWVFLALLWMISFYLYALGKVLGILLGVWVAWEWWLEEEGRWRNVAAYLLTAAAVSTAFIPNLLDWETYTFYRSLNRNEHILAFRTHPDFMHRWLGPECNPPYSVWDQVRGASVNTAQNLDKGYRLILRQIPNLGSAFLGVVVCVMAFGAKWRRWPLILLGFTAIIPLFLVGVTEERLVAVQWLIPFLQAVPFAFIAQNLKGAGKWEAIPAGFLILTMAGGLLAGEATRTYRMLDVPEPELLQLAQYTSRPENLPAYLLLPLDAPTRYFFLKFWTFDAQRQNGQGKTFQWVQADRVREFLEDARRWGLPGTAVFTTEGWVELSPPFPSLPKPVPVGEFKAIRLDQLPEYQPLPWQTTTIQAWQHSECCGCGYGYHERYSPRRVLWGPWANPVDGNMGAPHEIQFEFKIQGENGGAVPTLLHIEYSSFEETSPDYPFSMVEVLVDGTPAGGWQPQVTPVETALTPGILLGEMAPGKHTVTLRYSGLGEEKLIIWNVTISVLAPIPIN